MLLPLVTMRERITLVALLLAAAVQTAAAGEVRVTFPTIGAASDTQVTLRARREDGVEKTSIVPLAAGGMIALDEGLWELTATAPRWWSRSATLQVAAVPAELAMPMFRTVVVRGSVDIPTVNELTIGFAPPPAVPPSAIPAAAITCPIAEKRFACSVPAGLLDLTFRAPGYVAVYRWNEKLDTDRDAGIIKLRKGSSFTGTVAFAERQPKNAPAITVAVWRDSAGAQNENQKARVALARQTTTPTSRGFFHFALAPGDYLVEATAEGGLRSERRNVRVLDSRESQLRAPLVLERPHALTLRVDPPTAPYGKPWSATLVLKDRSGVVESEVRGEVPRNGEWRHEGLFSGQYALAIGRSEEDAWYAATIDVAGADVSHDAKIPLTHLSGKVTLAGKPLRTNLWFTKPNGTKAGILSRADGTFGPILMPDTPDDIWPSVEVECEEPYVRRTFTNVKLTKRDDENRELILEVKGATIFGDVVDTNGVVQTRALITATTADRKVVQIESESGAFVFNAIAPGRLALRANTPDGSETAGATNVDVVDDERTEVHLVVKPGIVIKGVVRSLIAGPVGGAGIASVSLDHWADFLGQITSDEEGRFRLQFAPGTRSAVVSVTAPGYAYRMLRLAPQPEPVPVFVETTGGTLVLAPPEKATEGTMPYVIHAGAILPLRVAAWLGGADADASGRVTIGLAEEGAYSLCSLTTSEIAAAADGWRPAERCSSGLLARGGSLALNVREARAQ
jgi:uncharacterized protein (DUF2141 family)